MKKKVLLLASIGVLACSIGATILTIGETNQFSNLQVKAERKEREVTFDGKSIEKETSKYVVFSAETENGNKVGICGALDNSGNLSFAERRFGAIYLYDHNKDFSASTYEIGSFVAINASFGSGHLEYVSEHDTESLSNGNRISCHGDPSDTPELSGFPYYEDTFVIWSITIYYSC